MTDKNRVQAAISEEFFPWVRGRLRTNPDEPISTREAFSAGFERGARWALRTSTNLSPHIALFIELLTLLGYANAETTDTPSDHNT